MEKKWGPGSSNWHSLVYMWEKLQDSEVNCEHKTSTLLQILWEISFVFVWLWFNGHSTLRRSLVHPLFYTQLKRSILKVHWSMAFLYYLLTNQADWSSYFSNVLECFFVFVFLVTIRYKLWHNTDHQLFTKSWKNMTSI